MVIKGTKISAVPPLIGQEWSRNIPTPNLYNIKKIGWTVDRYKKGVNTGVIASKVQFWYEQFEVRDRCCPHRHIFQT